MGYTGDIWMDEEGGVGVQSFYCCMGDELEICHPRFCKGVETRSQNPNTVALRGFRLIYPQLGDLTEGDKWNCVKYHHKKSGKQIIEFTEDLNLRKSYLVMETVTAHDHASIPQGGPAFATYYAEDYEGEEV